MAEKGVIYILTNPSFPAYIFHGKYHGNSGQQTQQDVEQGYYRMSGF